MSSPKRRIEMDVMKYAHSCPPQTHTANLAAGLFASPTHALSTLPPLTVKTGKNSTSGSRGPRKVRRHRCSTAERLADPSQPAPFEGGNWKIHVEIPDQYPYKSPSIGFVNRIFHPNIDELSGSVCLDVINQTWSPMYDMINIFEVFLPQLLRYPNPTDPLNGEAAALMMREPKSYDAKVKEYVSKYATKDAADEAGEDEESEDEMSSVGSYDEGEDDDDEVAGNMEEL
ncbi:hypothetical protein Vi05172_g4236 [Venturia inaequalis]|nr:hypothetical protein Vi05172_g4236 [Venturia inaequalis]